MATAGYENTGINGMVKIGACSKGQGVLSDLYE
jgi:hypothetical protein